jgi:toxin FitB
VIFILDTDVLSTFRKKKPHPSIAHWVAQAGWQEIATTVVTVMEIQRGVERARTQHPDTAKAVEEWLNGMLAVGEPQVLSMEVQASRLLARMYEAPALRHFIITAREANDQATGADLAIAAIAIATDAAVATNNVRHFLQINDEFPLPGLLDPVTLTWHIRPTGAQSPS